VSGIELLTSLATETDRLHQDIQLITAGVLGPANGIRSHTDTPLYRCVSCVDATRPENSRDFLLPDLPVGKSAGFECDERSAVYVTTV